MSRASVRDGDDWVIRVDLREWGELIGSGDETVTAVLLPDEQNPSLPPTAEQLAAGDFLEQNSAWLLSIVLDAMRTHYDDMRPRFLDFLNSPDTQMPPSPALREFIALHELRQLFIHCPTSTKLPRLGFQFRATWEVEHGVGVLTEGLQVIGCGGADVSFS